MLYLLVMYYSLKICISIQYNINKKGALLIDHVRKQDTNEDHLLTKVNSFHSWFQTRPKRPSLDRYLTSLPIETMSLQDILVINSIRQALIDKEQHPRS